MTSKLRRSRDRRLAELQRRLLPAAWGGCVLLLGCAGGSPRSEPTSPLPIDGGRPQAPGAADEEQRARVVVGDWRRERLDPGDRLLGLGVSQGELVALTGTPAESSLWTRRSDAWVRERVDSDEAVALYAQGADLVLVTHGLEDVVKVVHRTAAGTTRDMLTHPRGAVRLARGAGATWLAMAGATPGRVDLFRRSDQAARWELVATLDLDSPFTLALDPAGVAHVVGSGADATPVHRTVDASGVHRAPPLPAADDVAIAACAGRLFGVFHRGANGASVGVWDGATWRLAASAPGPRERSTLAFGDRCQAFVVDGFGELWAHGPGGWTPGPPLGIGAFAIPSLVVHGDEVHVGYSRTRDDRSGFDAWVATATLGPSGSAAVTSR